MPPAPSPDRRFPPPWTVRNSDGAYWVEDAHGHRFGFCYFVDRAVIGTGQEAKLTRDEARRLAHNIARLPELLGTQRARPNSSAGGGSPSRSSPDSDTA